MSSAQQVREAMEASRLSEIKADTELAKEYISELLKIVKKGGGAAKVSLPPGTTDTMHEVFAMEGFKIISQREGIQPCYEYFLVLDEQAK